MRMELEIRNGVQAADRLKDIRSDDNRSDDNISNDNRSDDNRSDDNRSDDDDENDNDYYNEGDGNGRGGGDDENSVTFEQTSACPSLFRMVDSLSSFHPLLLTMSLPHSPTLWKVTLPCMWSSFSMLQLDIIMLSYLM